MNFWKECKKYFTKKNAKYPSLQEKYPKQYNGLEHDVDEIILNKFADFKQQGEVMWLEDFYKKKLRHDEDSYFTIKNKKFDDYVSNVVKGKNE